jgi:LacI family transcriptional regulator
LVLAEHHYDFKAELRMTEQLIGHGVDAFASVGLNYDPALFALLEGYGRPYVLTWGVDPTRRHPSVGFDNRAAAFAMMRHLIDLGHAASACSAPPSKGTTAPPNAASVCAMRWCRRGWCWKTSACASASTQLQPPR